MRWRFLIKFPAGRIYTYLCGAGAERAKNYCVCIYTLSRVGARRGGSITRDRTMDRESQQPPHPIEVLLLIQMHECAAAAAHRERNQKSSQIASHPCLGHWLARTLRFCFFTHSSCVTRPEKQVFYLNSACSTRPSLTHIYSLGAFTSSRVRFVCFDECLTYFFVLYLLTCVCCQCRWLTTLGGRSTQSIFWKHSFFI